MIYFDVTKTGRSGPPSGLRRVSQRLRAELGAAAQPVTWAEWRQGAAARPDDWWLTTELFSAAERPGLADFLARKPCRCAAVFHDAIPLRLPQITWPQSVARHPEYLKRLAAFDRVFAVSAASRAELLGYWRWLGVPTPPPVDVLALGADGDGAPRATTPVAGGPRLLTVGILEPRKNQRFLLEVCAALWRAGLAFELHLVGRVNPHFGAPLVQQIKTLRREFAGLVHHAAADDATVAQLYAGARAAVFPTQAEGCGLPLLEALWRGVPCVCSDLPVLRENADGGGCLPVPLNDAGAWAAALRQLLTDDALHARLGREAVTRELPTWAGSARQLRQALGEEAPR